MQASHIEWTEASWNPVTGCTKVSPGCDHCYAETFAERWRGTPGHTYERGFDLQLRPERLEQPLRWKRPARIFVNSMSDLFHADIPEAYIAQVFEVMREAHWHTFQVLTKRAERMERVCRRLAVPDNVWLGVSIESPTYSSRIRHLTRIDAPVRWLSCEPLLAPLPGIPLDGIGWVVVGGESGYGARPVHPEWVREIREQCQTAGVPFFFKQWGAWAPWGKHFATDRDERGSWDSYVNLDGTLGKVAVSENDYASNWTGHLDAGFALVTRTGKKHAGRLLDGRTWDEMPAVAR